MNLFLHIAAFQDELPDPSRVWQECCQKGFDGVVAELRHAQTFAVHALPDRRSFEAQCEWIKQVAAGKPAGLRLVLGPQDQTAAVAVHSTPHDARWFAPGCNQNIGLIQSAVATSQIALLAVNGLGARAFDAVLKVCNGSQPIFCYVADKGEELAAVMQMAWLKARGHKTGIQAPDINTLCSAAALGTEYVMMLWKEVQGNKEVGEVIAHLREVSDIAQGKGYRPVTLLEIERLADAEVCLVAARRINPGHVLTEADVSVRAVRQRGLAPYLLPMVLSRVVRYPIDTGEPLNFGLLWEKGRHG